MCIGGAVPNLQSFHNDVNKLLHDIDRPINDDELSGDDEDLLVSLCIKIFFLNILNLIG